MPYFLDGNNLIGRERHTARPQDADRQALVGELAERLRSTRSTVAVFFDGPGRATTTLGRLTLRESGGSADEAILRELCSAPDPRQITVVTADRGLALRVRDAGGRVLPPGEFWTRFGTGGGPAEVSSADGARVNVEEWMDYFSDPDNRAK